MDLVEVVQEYNVNEKTIREILSTKFEGYEQLWILKGNTVTFVNNVMPLIKTEPLHMRAPSTYKWKVANGKITAVNLRAMKLTPSLAEVYFKFIYD